VTLSRLVFDAPVSFSIVGNSTPTYHHIGMTGPAIVDVQRSAPEPPVKAVAYVYEWEHSVEGLVGTVGVTKTGPGRLLLAYSSTFTGGLTISSGNVRAFADMALGASGQPVTINGGGLILDNASGFDT